MIEDFEPRILICEKFKYKDRTLDQTKLTDIAVLDKLDSSMVTDNPDFSEINTKISAIQDTNKQYLDIQM